MDTPRADGIDREDRRGRSIWKRARTGARYVESLDAATVKEIVNRVASIIDPAGT
ncbi:MAG: hypothetical protein P9F75_15440 [Candidatus Contendobacter sp.]|nr:hypothetical protein [Candidatus Contendobacter sp.]